jgi:hypothetical protein
MVEAGVFDVNGRRVQELIAPRFMTPGSYEVAWDGLDDRRSQVARGIYFVKLVRGDSVVVRSVIRE